MKTDRPLPSFGPGGEACADCVAFGYGPIPPHAFGFEHMHKVDELPKGRITESQILTHGVAVCVGGSGEPTVWYHFDAIETADVFADSVEECNRLRILIGQSRQLLLRSVPVLTPLPALAYVRADAIEEPVTALMGGTLTLWELSGDLVRPPSINLLVPTWTYEQVAALWETYADAASAGRTYLEWMKDPRP